MTPQTTRIVLALFCLTLWSCAWGATTMPFPIKEVDFPAEDWSPLWLDNTHVLFRGGATTERLHPGLLHRHYVWDVDRAILARETRFDEARMICVQSENLSYMVPDSEAKRSKRVAFVNGQQIQLPQEFWFNPLSCHISTNKPEWVRAKEEGREVVPLLEEHGYIDRGVAKEISEVFPLLYYRPGIAKAISLGLTNWQVEKKAGYIPFLNGYLLEGALAPGNAHPFWLLHPNGTVDQIFTPEENEWAQLSWPWQLMTKQGPIFSSLHPRGSHSKEAGLYLWSARALTKVADGFFTWGSVSPDGRRLAVIRWQSGKEVPNDKRYRLYIVDLGIGGEDAN